MSIAATKPIGQSNLVSDAVPASSFRVLSISKQTAQLFWILFGILALNFLLRWGLDHANRHINSFLGVIWKDQLPNLYSLPWWRYLLPVESLTGSWCSTSLLLIHGLENLLGRPVHVFYLLNAVLITTGFTLSWRVFHSKVFSSTLGLFLALTTFNHHVYLLSGGMAMYCIITYLMCFLYCQYELLRPGANLRLWGSVGGLTLVVYVLSYEGWLDCVAWMWIAYPCLIVFFRKHAMNKQAAVASCVLGVTTVVSFLYVWIKMKLGHGQGSGSESDLVFNYGGRYSIVIIEDLIVHWFSMFHTAIVNFLPPELGIYSVSSWKYGTKHLMELQNGYHADKVQLVANSHMFLWRFYAGALAMIFLFWLYKSGRIAWQTGSFAAVAFFLAILMVLLPGTTHTVVKYRPMHSTPLLGYHVYFGIVGGALLLSYSLMWVHDNFKNRKWAWTIIALTWLSFGYGALARPSLLSHMAVESGFAPYPDAMKTLKELFRGKAS